MVYYLKSLLPEMILINAIKISPIGIMCTKPWQLPLFSLKRVNEFDLIFTGRVLLEIKIQNLPKTNADFHIAKKSSLDGDVLLEW